MALKEIGTNKIEIYPKDTGSNANITLRSANALKKIAIAKLKMRTKTNCSKIFFLY